MKYEMFTFVKPHKINNLISEIWENVRNYAVLLIVISEKLYIYILASGKSFYLLDYYIDIINQMTLSYHQLQQLFLCLAKVFHCIYISYIYVQVHIYTCIYIYICIYIQHK